MPADVLARSRAARVRWSRKKENRRYDPCRVVLVDRAEQWVRLHSLNSHNEEDISRASVGNRVALLLPSEVP